MQENRDTQQQEQPSRRGGNWERVKDDIALALAASNLTESEVGPLPEQFRWELVRLFQTLSDEEIAKLKSPSTPREELLTIMEEAERRRNQQG